MGAHRQGTMAHDDPEGINSLRVAVSPLARYLRILGSVIREGADRKSTPAEPMAMRGSIGGVHYVNRRDN